MSNDQSGHNERIALLVEKQEFSQVLGITLGSDIELPKRDESTTIADRNDDNTLQHLHLHF